MQVSFEKRWSRAFSKTEKKTTLATVKMLTLECQCYQVFLKNIETFQTRDNVNDYQSTTKFLNEKLVKSVELSRVPEEALFANFNNFLKMQLIII